MITCAQKHIQTARIHFPGGIHCSILVWQARSHRFILSNTKGWTHFHVKSNALIMWAIKVALLLHGESMCSPWIQSQLQYHQHEHGWLLAHLGDYRATNQCVWRRRRLEEKAGDENGWVIVDKMRHRGGNRGRRQTLGWERGARVGELLLFIWRTTAEACGGMLSLSGWEQGQRHELLWASSVSETAKKVRTVYNSFAFKPWRCYSTRSPTKISWSVIVYYIHGQRAGQSHGFDSV